MELFAQLTDADSGGVWSGPVAGVYTYTIAASGTCPESSATVTVSEDEAPNAGEDGTITVCEGTSVDVSTLVSEVGGTYENTSGMGNLTDADFDTTDLEPGNYIITYTVTNDCGEDQAEITVVVDEDQNCDDSGSGCETAFAYYEDNNTCFIGDPDVNAGGRWGWTNFFANEGDYVMDLYSGAGQCDLSKGEKSGIVKIDYNGGLVNVSIELLSGFVMSEAQLYVGGVKYPVKNNGQATIAPGQYPYNSGTLNDVTTYDFDPIDVSSINGGVYIIVHAVTCKKSSSSGKVAQTRITPYPMTFKNDLNLNVEIPYNAKIDVEIFDVNGRCVLTKKNMTVKPGSNNIHLNVSGLSPDMYILILNTGREKIVKKLLSIK
jgi:hypothetical protein